ncbi:hypothetical protein EDB80DRAFT_880243 [Ilyonectria destructans]|nr:hypothetical protein EDB80DRAFT_880243 [Ilyonectria destructans]
MPDNDIRLLALDGGGVRRPFSLLESSCPPSSPTPRLGRATTFYMNGGTGGVFAVMLGRLCMSVEIGSVWWPSIRTLASAWASSFPFMAPVSRLPGTSMELED